MKNKSRDTVEESFLKHAVECLLLLFTFVVYYIKDMYHIHCMLLETLF